MPPRRSATIPAPRRQSVEARLRALETRPRTMLPGAAEFAPASGEARNVPTYGNPLYPATPATGSAVPDGLSIWFLRDLSGGSDAVLMYVFVKSGGVVTKAAVQLTQAEEVT